MCNEFHITKCSSWAKHVVGYVCVSTETAIQIAFEQKSESSKQWENWKPLWKTNWKCPFRVCVLLLTDTRKRSKWLLLSCYMGHELRTAKDNGHLCVIPAVFLPCAWSVLLALVGEAMSPQLACAFVNAARSKHLTGLTWFLLRCMCFRSDSTIALKSSPLIAGAEKPLPSFWHIYSSPTFASLEPSSPPPPASRALYTKDFSFPFQFSPCFQASVASTFHGLTQDGC